MCFGVQQSCDKYPTSTFVVLANTLGQECFFGLILICPLELNLTFTANTNSALLPTQRCLLRLLEVLKAANLKNMKACFFFLLFELIGTLCRLH